MANQKPQNLQNHVRVVPPYHMFVFGVFLINLAYTIYRPVRYGFSVGGLVNFLLATALIVLFFYARIFALTVQDRVIRLEMRMRLAELLPGELHPRIPEFTVAQLIALRFASDAELPALARKVLDEKLNDRKVIKQLVRDWQADYLRA